MFTSGLELLLQNAHSPPLLSVRSFTTPEVEGAAGAGAAAGGAAAARALADAFATAAADGNRALFAVPKLLRVLLAAWTTETHVRLAIWHVTVAVCRQ